MGSKSSTVKLSKDQQQLHSFYVPNFGEKKLETMEKKVSKNKMKYMGRAFVLGFALEYYLGVGRTYENINRKSVLRRLGTYSYMQMQRKNKMNNFNNKKRMIKKQTKSDS